MRKTYDELKEENARLRLEFERGRNRERAAEKDGEDQHWKLRAAVKGWRDYGLRMCDQRDGILRRMGELEAEAVRKAEDGRVPVKMLQDWIAEQRKIAADNDDLAKRAREQTGVTLG